jgi:hypothetical protein
MAQLDDGSGTAPNYGGGSGGAGGGASDVELTFSDVEKIGQDTAALSGEAEAAKAVLGDARGNAGAFGSYPPALALHEHHQAVVNVFEDTLAAITTDLDTFGNTIVQAVHAHEQTDEDARATLASVASTLSAAPHLRDQYDQSRNNQRDTLADVTVDDPDALAEQHPELDPDAIDAIRRTQGDGTGDGGAFEGGDGP